MEADKKIKELESKIEELQRRSLPAGEAKKYQEQLEFLANTALDFLGQTDTSDIFNYIGEKLFQLIDDGIVIVSSFDETSSELNVK